MDVIRESIDPQPTPRPSSPLHAVTTQLPMSTFRRAHPTSCILIFTGLLVWYGLWLLTYWPGVLGNDSIAILMEVDGTNQSGKTAFWYYFVRLFYGTTGRVETPIAVTLIISALVFARILSWSWAQELRKTCLVGLAFIAATPHMVVFLATLYPDGIFAVGSVGLLFELWLCARRRAVSMTSAGLIALTLPLALFMRSNGLLWLGPAAVVLLLVNRRGRKVLGALLVLWCTLGYLASQLHPTRPQGAMFPMVVFETVHFLRPHAMNELWRTYPGMNDPWVQKAPMVSGETKALLQRHHSLENMLAYSDPAYWDMLIFHPQGPQLIGLSEDDRQTLIREFWRYNLWHNLPSFLGSRVTVFFTAALAEGAFPALDYAPVVLPRTKAVSKYRHFGLTGLEGFLASLLRASHAVRWLLWAPWLGLALLYVGARRSLSRRDAALALLVWPMIAQLGAIALFSSAGEYRYLLPFFVLPLALMPALALTNSRHAPEPREAPKHP